MMLSIPGYREEEDRRQKEGLQYQLTYPSVHPSIHLPIYPSIYSSNTHPSIHLSIVLTHVLGRQPYDEAVCMVNDGWCSNCGGRRHEYSKWCFPIRSGYEDPISNVCVRRLPVIPEVQVEDSSLWGTPHSREWSRSWNPHSRSLGESPVQIWWLYCDSEEGMVRVTGPGGVFLPGS